MLLRMRKSKAQSITEYAVLMGLLLAAIVAIQVYVKRSITGRLKSAADDIGEQFTTGRSYTLEKTQQSAREETSGVGTAGELKESWTDSTIAATFAKPAEAKLPYAGHELNKQDYVTATAGAGAVGKHGTFDSGVLATTKPLEDDK